MPALDDFRLDQLATDYRALLQKETCKGSFAESELRGHFCRKRPAKKRQTNICIHMYIYHRALLQKETCKEKAF